MKASTDTPLFLGLTTLTELTLVGAIVVKPELLSSVLGIVEAGHFSDSACRMIWTAIVDLGKQQRRITVDDIVSRIEETGGFSNVDCGGVTAVRSGVGAA